MPLAVALAFLCASGTAGAAPKPKRDKRAPEQPPTRFIVEPTSPEPEPEAAPARVQEEIPSVPVKAPVWTGPEAAMRTGFAIPGGSSYGDGLAFGKDWGDPGSGMVPIWVDIGYRINKHIYTGLYGSFGFAIQSNESCPPDFVCSGYSMRTGLSAQGHVLPEGKIDPWFGLGFGYEWYRAQVTPPNEPKLSGVSHGFELVNVTAGVLYKPTPQRGLGPFISMCLGQFSHIGGLEGSFSTAMHQWFMFGIHGSFFGER